MTMPTYNVPLKHLSDQMRKIISVVFLIRKVFISENFFVDSKKQEEVTFSENPEMKTNRLN